MPVDLPDYRAWVEAVYLLAASLAHGADALKAADPDDGDVYLATNTEKLYVCYADGVWTDITAAYLLLAGGTMSGAIAMGTNKITGLGDPTAAQDAATKAYTDLFTLLTTFNAHKARHQDTGADEIGVTGLSGLLADDQHVLDAEVLVVAAALVHASRHQDTGADEISLAGLDGEPSTLTTHKGLSTGTHGVTGTIVGSEDVDDTPVDGATTDPISSNWAYDHAADLTAHNSLLWALVFGG